MENKYRKRTTNKQEGEPHIAYSKVNIECIIKRSRKYDNKKIL